MEKYFSPTLLGALSFGALFGLALSRYKSQQPRKCHENSKQNCTQNNVPNPVQQVKIDEHANNQPISFQTIATENIQAIDARLKKWVPSSMNEKDIEGLFFTPVANIPQHICKWDDRQLTKSINEPINNILQRGGKRWRSILMILVAEAFGKKIDLDFVAITEIIHNGTLILDDIEDDSKDRRGQPCLHITHGIDVAANAGNTMYFMPLAILRKWKSALEPEVLIKCYEIYAQEMLSVHFGQGIDIGWHSSNVNVKLNNQENSTIAEYLQMCAAKTGALARMSVRLAAALCKASEEQEKMLSHFAEGIGIAFQIQDDLLNITASDVANSKGGLGEDIHEGKRTLMVIHALENAPKTSQERLRQILEMKTFEQNLIQEAIEIMRRAGSLKFAQDMADNLVHNAWEAVDKVLPDSLAKRKLKAIADFMVKRKN